MLDRSTLFHCKADKRVALTACSPFSNLISILATQVRVYTAGGIRTELQDACREFLTAAVSLTAHSRVMIPKIMHWYARDFSSDVTSLLEWIAQQLPDERRKLVEECIEVKRGKKSSQQMAVVSYDWSFRYLLQHTPDS
jgi:hypothetical protein